LETGAIDIVQPDVTLAGGLSECRANAYLASSFSVRCNPHAWGTTVSIGATLQLLGAIPDYRPRLLPGPPKLGADVMPNPLREDITDWLFILKDGCIMIPSEPGLGIDVDPDRMTKWTVNKTITEL
jgi:D-galactarolactone cycloisomerase